MSYFLIASNLYGGRLKDYMYKKILTLCWIHQHPQVLLGMKKRGFGVGKWNGFGGKVQPEESIENAARRELEEEVGIIAHDLNKKGVLEFVFESKLEEILEVHVFVTESFEGDPQESEEMRPEWFQVDSIPFDTMWPPDIYWVPLLLEGKKFKGKFLFNDNEDILERFLEEVSEL